MDRAKEAIVYIAGFTGPLSGNLVLSLLVTLEQAWQVEQVEILLSVSAFMFPFAVMQLFSGTISDAYDRRSTLLFGLGTYAAGSALAALSGSLSMFILARVVQGVGYAFVNPVLVALLSEIAGPSRQGQAMGYFGSATTAGISVGPLLGGVFAGIDWRLAFVVVALLAMSMFLAVRFVFEKERLSTSKPSLGSVRAMLSTALGDKRTMSVSASGFCAFMAFAGVISFVATHMGAGPPGLTPEQIGVALSASGVIGIFVAPVAGTLVDKKGARCCVTVGLAISSFAAFSFMFASSYPHFVALMVMSGFGGAFIWSSLLTMVVAVPSTMKGTASSVFNSSRFLGFALSPILLAPVYLSLGFGATMVLCAAIGVLALVLALLPGRAPAQGQG